MMLPRRYFWIFYKTSSFVSLLLYFLKKNIILFSAPLFIIFFFLVSLGIFCFYISTFRVVCLAYADQKYSKVPLHIHHILEKADRNVGKHVEHSSRNVHGTTTWETRLKFNMHILNASSIIFLYIFPREILAQVDQKMWWLILSVDLMGRRVPGYLAKHCLGVSMRVFLDKITIRNGRLNKADCPP